MTAIDSWGPTGEHKMKLKNGGGAERHPNKEESPLMAHCQPPETDAQWPHQVVHSLAPCCQARGMMNVR